MTKTPGQETPRTIERICTEGFSTAFVRVSCTRPTKNRRGGPRCVMYFLGGPGMCDKVWQGEGVKICQNSVTYFMGGPLSSFWGLHQAYTVTRLWLKPILYYLEYVDWTTAKTCERWSSVGNLAPSAYICLSKKTWRWRWGDSVKEMNLLKRRKTADLQYTIPKRPAPIFGSTQ